jgi:hypothetical protein
MTSAQLQYAYRLAVQDCLVVFYRKSNAESERLVNAWWKRMSAGTGILSGMYLHSEALTTATDLADTTEVILTEETRQRYRTIIGESTRLALSSHTIPRRKQVELSKQMAG